jgi:nucleoside-diphosphate-sugar epimerase
MKNIIVTGGAGFLGSHLIDRLVQNKKDKIYCIDILKKKKCIHLKNALKYKNFKYIRCDINNKKLLNKKIPKSINSIFHFSSIVGVSDYINKPDILINSIIEASKNILDICVKKKAKLYFASTSEVYGKNPKIPWSESDDRVLGNPSIDRWSYSTGKALIEHLIHAYHKRYKINFTIFRFFNVYGPRQRENFVVSKNINNLINHKPLEIYDEGKMTRCFTYIDDAIDCVIKAFKNSRSDLNTFNIGSKKEVKINNIINFAVKSFNTRAKIIKVDTQKKYGKKYQDIDRRVPNVEFVKKKLNWEAKTSYQVGITKTIQWYLENKK